MATKVRKFFTPSSGSRARNIARAVLPAMVLLDVPWFATLDGAQLSALYIAIEVVFAGGAVAVDKVRA